MRSALNGLWVCIYIYIYNFSIQFLRHFVVELLFSLHSSMEIIESNKRGLKLCYNGYMYTTHAVRKAKVWWKCVLRSSCQCKASLVTNTVHENPEVGRPHNHAPNDTQVRLAKVRNAMKDRAASTQDKPGQIYSQGVSECDAEVLALIPSADTCKRTLRNQRPTPRVPTALQDLGELPNEFTQTLGPNPEQFLLYDNGPNRNNRILVFGTRQGLEMFANSETAYMDGNFAMSPNIFHQLYIIRIPFEETSVTALYALLPNKTRATYEEVFQAIVDNCNNQRFNINDKTFVTDFEDSALRAIAAVFGRDSSKGCFYHLTQSTWRKVQDLGLAQQYTSNEEFRLFCGMIDALAFLPLTEVNEGMQYLKTLIPFNIPESEELLSYFDRTYVSGTFRHTHQAEANGQNLAPVRIRRIPPMFPPRQWNVHHATINNNPRTNNICEGWNNKFYNLVGHHHPSVWRVINWFQREEATVKAIILQNAVGRRPHKRSSRRHIQMQERLRNLCVARQEKRIAIPNFLRGVGWNIRLNHE